MESLTVSRTLDATVDDVADVMGDTESFVRASGYDEVRTEGGRLHIENRVGIANLELVARIVEEGPSLEYVQEEGIFEAMRTAYAVEEDDDGVTVTARTEFAVDAGIVGEFLDATVVKRQRRKELTTQLDYLEAHV
ncbi:MAG: SRPBCC family protein [Haloarculaceae archaeon]